MRLFDTIKEPVFLKESSSAEKQLEVLKKLEKQTSGDLLKKIREEIKIVEAGIYGENQIMFELKNSHMPMVVMHDLYFEKDGYTAQIDFLIITRARSFILECKNLIGNIDIDENGNFTRTLSYGKYYRKEGIYSPLTQNQRHMEVIKKVRIEAKGNTFTKVLFETYFTQNYRSVVVLANPKTVLNAKHAAKEVKNQVIRADQLINYIKKVNSEKGVELNTEKEMMKTAQFFMDRSMECPVDYLKKYQEELEIKAEKEELEFSFSSLDKLETEDSKIEQRNNQENSEETVKTEKDQVLCPRCGAVMVKRMAAKGPNAGKEFYGCSKFPKCRGIINIKQAGQDEQGE